MEDEDDIIDEILEGLNDEDDVVVVGSDEESAKADNEEALRFDITSYGWDVDVEGLVKRMNRESIYVPGFQRGFVWKKPDKSRFIESLILGLPVPTLFLARDSNSEKLLNIIDGQQRLRTLQSYLNGDFSLSGKDISEDLRGRFHSSRKSEFGERRAYPKAKTLSNADERTLEDAVIHSVVIRPNPKDDDENLGHEYNRAIIQIFKRLNTTGTALEPQEVRASIFYGPLLSLIQELNDNENWRALFGVVHGRMKDQEAITRALALDMNGLEYRAPMPKFLDNFMEQNRSLQDAQIDDFRKRFTLAVLIVRHELGENALKRGATFLLTRLDALIVGLMNAAKGLDSDQLETMQTELMTAFGDVSVAQRLASLEADNRGLNDDGEEIEDVRQEDRGFNWSVAKFTNDTNRVEVRLRTAKAAFRN
jgi:hypothetical protein